MRFVVGGEGEFIFIFFWFASREAFVRRPRDVDDDGDDDDARFNITCFFTSYVLLRTRRRKNDDERVSRW